jgi:hypothetical protein
MSPKRPSIIAAEEEAHSWSGCLTLSKNRPDLWALGERCPLLLPRRELDRLGGSRNFVALQTRGAALRLEPNLIPLNSDFKAYRHLFENQLEGRRRSREEERRRLSRWVTTTIASLPDAAAPELLPLMKIRPKRRMKVLSARSKATLRRSADLEVPNKTMKSMSGHSKDEEINCYTSRLQISSGLRELVPSDFPRNNFSTRRARRRARERGFRGAGATESDGRMSNRDGKLDIGSA